METVWCVRVDNYTDIAEIIAIYGSFEDAMHDFLVYADDYGCHSPVYCEKASPLKRFRKVNSCGTFLILEEIHFV